MVLDVDTVIMALGTSPNPLIKSTTKGLEINKKGGIVVNEDGLPSFFAVAQEDVGYQITYTRTDDGRFVMDSAQCVYGYIYNHSAEPTNDFFTPTGEILYQ